MKCPEGCTCGRHSAQSGRKLTPEAQEEAHRKKREKDAARMRERRAADPEGTRTKAREQYRKNGRKHNLKWKFGITPERFAQMVVSQGGRCYLCEEQMSGVIHIDHDRKCCPTQRSCGTCIRGLACQLCNQGIGQFRDDPERMRAVAANLEAAQKLLARGETR